MKSACLAVLVFGLFMAACGGQDVIDVTSSYRTNQEQMKLYQPGHSFHETAQAVDIVEFQLNGKNIRLHKNLVAPLKRADAAMKRTNL